MEKVERSSSLELLRILCIISIVADHFTYQSGIIQMDTLAQSIFYATMLGLSRMSCSVFIIISAWFLVEKEFRIKRVFHTWLTVIMYTLPITLAAYFLKLYSVDGLLIKTSMLPITGSPLWFASYYMVLILLSPVLNMILSRAPLYILEYYLLVMFLLQVMYVTLTGDLGYFGHDIWIFINLYLFTGYLKCHCSFFPHGKKSLLLFLALWLCLCLAFGFCLRGSAIDPEGMKWPLHICNAYRAQLQALPNLVMAFSVFFAFKSWNLEYSPLINKIAATALGVYCLHQVPGWYSYLWEHIFHAKEYAVLLSGVKRALYTMICIFVIWSVGVMVELLRERIAYYLLERHGWYRNLCADIDRYVNHTTAIPIRELLKNRKVVAYTAGLGLYFILTKAIEIAVKLNM